MLTTLKTLLRWRTSNPKSQIWHHSETILSRNYSEIYKQCWNTEIKPTIFLQKFRNMQANSLLIKKRTSWSKGWYTWRPRKLSNFQDPPIPSPLSIYVQNSSAHLTLDVQFQPNPPYPPPPLLLQIITSQLKENIIQAAISWLYTLVCADANCVNYSQQGETYHDFLNELESFSQKFAVWHLGTGVLNL